MFNNKQILLECLEINTLQSSIYEYHSLSEEEQTSLFALIFKEGCILEDSLV